MVFGNSNGLAVVDYLQKTLLLNMGTSELYSPSDPYQRQPRSPRKTRQPSGGELHCDVSARSLPQSKTLLSHGMCLLSSLRMNLCANRFLRTSVLSCSGCVDVGEGDGRATLGNGSSSSSGDFDCQLRLPPLRSGTCPPTGGVSDRLAICSFGADQRHRSKRVSL